MPGLTRRALIGAVAVAGAAPAPAWTRLPATPILPRPSSSNLLDGTHGARLFHAEFGSGQPVLLLHGGLANADYWGHLIASLSRDYRVLAMDARGHGRSTLGDAGLDYSLLAKDALAVMDARAVDRCAVVGWSDGGIAGLLLATNAPQRVTRLFTFGANDNHGGGRTDAGAKPVVQTYFARCAAEYQTHAPHPTEFNRLKQALQVMWRAGPDLPPSRLATVNVPTTISAGEHDEFIASTRTRALASAIRGARLLIQPGVSHFAMLQEPSRFDAHVQEFLRR